MYSSRGCALSGAPADKIKIKKIGRGAPAVVALECAVDLARIAPMHAFIIN